MKKIGYNDVFAHAMSKSVNEAKEPDVSTAGMEAVLVSNGFRLKRQINPISAAFEKDCLLLEDHSGITVNLIVSVSNGTVTVVLRYQKNTTPVIKSFKYDLVNYRSSNNVWVRLSADARTVGLDLNRPAPRGF